MMGKVLKGVMCFLGVCLATSVRASIPTFDFPAFELSMKSYAKMVGIYATTMSGWYTNHSDNQDMQKTSEEIRGELNSIHKGLSGNRVEVAKLANEKAKQVVEDDFYDALTKADKDGNYKYTGSDDILQKHGLNEACEKLVGSSKIGTSLGVVQTTIAALQKDAAGTGLGAVSAMTSTQGTSRAMKRCNNNATRLATAQAVLKKMDENIKERKTQVQKLSDRVSHTQDQKESADLTAAIAKANLEIDLDLNKMFVIKQLIENQQRLDNQADMIGKK